MVSNKVLLQANRRAQKMRSTHPHALRAHYDPKVRRVVIELSSRLIVSFSPADAEGLEGATVAQLREIEITPSGLGLYFPKLDADLYLPALLEGMMGSKRWMAARLGQSGGRSVSHAKRKASRMNGKLGGRPKKSAVS